MNPQAKIVRSEIKPVSPLPRWRNASAIAVALAAFFLYRTWPGLRVYFHSDDMMNLYWAWTAPLERLVLANLVPFTTEYRPLGGTLYRSLFALFGFDPFPFRVAAYALLLLNVYLLFRFARRLARSTEIGLLAALIGAYHPRFFDLYGNNGAIYDILCYTFFLLAVDYYVKHRDAGTLSGLRLLVFGALVTASLNAKEMALTLPGVLLGYEAVYHRPCATRRAILAWARQAGPALALSALLAISAFVGKTRPGSLLHGHALYTPQFTARQYFVNARYMMSDLFDIEGARPGIFGFKSRTAVLLWASMFAAAALLRRKHLTFAAAFALITPVPVMFIPYRGFFVMYLPYAGWAIYAAALAVEGRDYVLRRLLKRPLLSPRAWAPRRVALFCLAALLTARHTPSIADQTVSPSQWAALGSRQRELKQTMLSLQPSIPKGSRILFLRDAFGDSFTPRFLISLLYRDPTLQVEQAFRFSSPPDLNVYHFVFDYDGTRYTRVKP